MERTNYVNKAKNLILKAARTSALVIVPLAAAVSAHAGSIALPNGNVSCSINVSGSCFGADSPLADLGSGIQGLSFFTSGGFTQTLFPPATSGGEDVTLSLADFGTVSGTIPGGTVIPVDWAFTMSAFSGATIQSWTLTFELGSTSGGSDYGATSGSGIGGGFFSNSGSLVVSQSILGGNSLFETVLLDMVVTNPGPGGVQVTVPNLSTWDFQSVTTPEPGSFALIGAGLALVGALARRRRK